MVTQILVPFFIFQEFLDRTGTATFLNRCNGILRIPVREITEVDEYSREAKVPFGVFVFFFWGAFKAAFFFGLPKSNSDRAKTKKKQKGTKENTCRVWPTGWWLAFFEAILEFSFFDYMQSYATGATNVGSWSKPIGERSADTSGEPLVEKEMALNGKKGPLTLAKAKSLRVVFFYERF